MIRRQSRSQAQSLPAAVDGIRLVFESRAGVLNAYQCGDGPPMLLIHSINAAASAAEVGPLVARYAATRCVFALDLPGFGFSERSDREYNPRLMTDAIRDVLDQIRGRCGGVPVDALALSLSSEFLARAALESPAAFRSLALVSPTGFRGGRARRGAPGTTLFKPWAYRLLRGGGWGETLYGWLTRPGVIRYFLQRTWGSRDIDERLWQYDVLTARQTGSMYAPLYFLSGGLFSADIHTIYERLELPVWMSHGIRGDFTDYRAQTLIQGRGNWRLSVFPTGALPFFEVPGRFFAEYDAFLENPPVMREAAAAAPDPTADGSP
jgi:pimeloyl-ACP methyl ester carboxylesterase